MRIKQPEIISEDEAIIVCRKEAGVAVQTARAGQADVVSLLKNYRAKKKEEPYIGLIHRLDQPVEGVMVFAKTPQATAKLSAQVSSRKKKKEYLAVALLVGILCLILAIPVKKETINETNTAIEEKSEDLKEGAWQEQIQARLQNMLNESEGAGETKVFLTFENSWENVVEKDENQTVFQKDATGNQTPYVKMQKYPKISGPYQHSCQR